MTENNHEEKTPATEEKEEKFCPFRSTLIPIGHTEAACIRDRCVLWVELVHAIPGPHGGFKKETFGMCSFPALCEIMSSRPVAAPPQPRPAIQLPRNMGRG